MDYPMLGKLVHNLTTVPAKMLGTLVDLVDRLKSKDGELWFTNLKKFLRKEEVWVKRVVGYVQLITPFVDSDFFKEELSGYKVVEDLEDDGFDPGGVVLEDCLDKGEASISGEVRLARHKERGHVLLGAKAFLWFWQNQDQIPKEWKKLGATYFFGTVLEDPDGRRYVLCLGWFEGTWRWCGVLLRSSFGCR